MHITRQVLREDRARQVEALEELLTKAEGECRVLNAPEQERFDGLTAEIIAIDRVIEKELTMDTESPAGALRPLIATPTSLSSGLPQDAAQLIERAGRVSYEVKTSLRALTRNIIGDTLTSPNVGIGIPPNWRGVIDGSLPLMTLLWDLLPTVSVTGAGIMQHRLTFTEPPPDSGNHAAQVAEAALKPESDMQISSTTVSWVVFAHWVAVTRQCLADIPSLRNLIDTLLLNGLRRKIDAYLLTTLTAGAGTYTPPAAATNPIDAAVLALSQLAAMGGTDVVFALNPADLALATIARCSGSGCYLGRPPAEMIPGRIVASATIPVGTFLCFSREAAYVAEREAANVFVGLKNDDLLKNLLTVLAEARLAAVLSDPRFLLKGTLPEPAESPEELRAPASSVRHAGAPRRA